MFRKEEKIFLMLRKEEILICHSQKRGINIFLTLRKEAKIVAKKAQTRLKSVFASSELIIAPYYINHIGDEFCRS